MFWITTQVGAFQGRNPLSDRGSSSRWIQIFTYIGYESHGAERVVNFRFAGQLDTQAHAFVIRPLKRDRKNSGMQFDDVAIRDRMLAADLLPAES